PRRAHLPLAGVPFAVKNLFNIAGLPTLAGSKIEATKPPAARDALLVRRLEAEGAVLVGALNMDEYAYGFTTENSHAGPTRNPHDRSRISGGSSGGSAAAVAAGQVPLTLGSDTNGSIRVPSSLCGCFGLKPTFGRLPRTGSYPFVASLDHLGPFARSAADLALAYDAMQGADPHDPACAPRDAQPVLPRLGQGTDG
ncbi:MAG: AtzE family amidohydrolase, partial [Alphaproteobacteria bacterium]|nr:AtzE family amidohydrolase [Alphaproteobacteria bacterium]